MSQMFVKRGSAGEHLGWGFASEPAAQAPAGGTVFLITAGATVPPSDGAFTFSGDNLVPIDPLYPSPPTFVLQEVV